MRRVFRHTRLKTTFPSEVETALEFFCPCSSQRELSSEIKRFWPPLRSLETLHDSLSFMEFDRFLGHLLSSRTPLPFPPETPLLVSAEGECISVPMWFVGSRGVQTAHSGAWPGCIGRICFFTEDPFAESTEANLKGLKEEV